MALRSADESDKTRSPPPALDHFADLRVEVGEPQVLSQGPRGMRRLVPITGGKRTATAGPRACCRAAPISS